MYKKGVEKYLSIWWFVMIAIVVGSIVIAILSFYSAELDVREIEAIALGDSILDCFVENGRMKVEVLGEDFDIFDSCGLARKSFEGETDFYFSVSFLDQNGQNLREDITGGDSSFLLDCEILKKEEGEEVEAKYFPKCVEQELEVSYVENGKILFADLKILTASNQRVWRVPVV